jgi:hypothetical protein
MKRLEKNDIRQEYIIPALDAFESIMDEGVTCEPFWNEVSNHPEYPTSKVFTWLNHLEQSMCSSEPASEFEILMCEKLPKLAELLADWDMCVELCDK